jgi:hypothetical protein
MNFSKLMEYIEDGLETIKKPLYLWFVLLPYILYVVSMFGLIYLNPTYVELLKSLTQIAIAIILLIRFNPLKTEHTLKKYDETIIFGTALILLTNASLTNEFINYMRSKI